MNLHEFFIVCPLVFLAGFVDAIAGGGGLISLPAYMFAGVPVHNAIRRINYHRQRERRCQHGIL